MKERNELKNVCEVSNISDFKGENPINKNLEHRRRNRFDESDKFGIKNVRFRILVGIYMMTHDKLYVENESGA